MKSFEFDPTRNLIVPKDDGRKEIEEIEEIPNIAPAKAEEERQQEETEEREDDEYEIEHKSYEAPVERAEIDRFVEALDDKLEEKARALGITDKEGLELFRQQAFWLAKLDMKNTDGQAFAEELEEMKLNQGGLDFLSTTILDAVDDIHRNRKGKLVGEHFSLTQAALEFVGKHKRVFNLGTLALYLSTFGSGALKAMSGDQAKVILDYDEVEDEGYAVDGILLSVAEDNDTRVESGQENNSVGSGSTETLEAFERFEETNMTEGDQEASIGQITTAELMDNPELINLIDSHRDLNSPINILEQISPAGEFSHGEVHLAFVMEDSDSVCLKNLSADDESISRLYDALQEKYDLRLNELETQGIPLEMFLEEETGIVGVIAEELGVPAEELMTYADHAVVQDTSQIEIVKFADLHVPVDKDDPETARLKEMKEDIYAKNGLDAFGQIVVDAELSEQVENINTNEDGLVDYTTQEARESFLHHNQEERLAAAEAELQEQLEAEGYSTGHDDYDSVLARAIQDSDNGHMKAKIANLGINEIHAEEYENSEEFQEMFLDALAEDGYSLADVEEIAQKNPKKAIEIASRTIGNHMDYSKLEAKQIHNGSHGTSLDVLHQDLREESMPAASLGNEAGVCHDYAVTMAAGLDVLEKMGISNLDNMAVMATTLAGVHEYVLIAAYEGDTVQVSLVDPTFADNGSVLDAVDQNHSYHGISAEEYELKKEMLEERAAEEEAARKETVAGNFKQIMAAHEEIRHRIELADFFVFQQRIVDFITKYHPEKTRGRKIQLEKDSYRAILEHEHKLAELRQKIDRTDDKD